MRETVRAQLEIPPPLLVPARGGPLRSKSVLGGSTGNQERTEGLSAQRSTGVSQFQSNHSQSLPGFVQDIVQSPGQPLDVQTRAFFEPRFGHDFGRVRVHTGSSAAASADALNAQAFTTGQHIVFGNAQYVPETPRGRDVLAHELAHTLQPNSPGSPGIHRIPKDPQGAPFEGEIIPWSAALHESASESGKVLADLPRGQRVTVQGGHAWILVETTVDGNKLSGYVSHELIRQISAPQAPAQATEKAAEETAKEVTKSTAETKSSSDEAASPAAESPAPVTESANLTTLKELLGAAWNVDEIQVLAVMGTLSPGEVATVVSDTWYRDRAVGALGDDEMIQALNAMKVTGTRRHEWMQAEGVPIYTVLSQPEFEMTSEGISINPTLYWNTRQLAQAVIDNNLANDDIRYSEGMRTPTKAHRWSTAYYIRKEVITQDRLEALPGGKDLDGNLWWKTGWSQSQAIENAYSIWDGAKAYEGYKLGDPRRLPNVDATKSSQHCFGEAVDVKIRWRNGDGWHAEANALVDSFGLSRPEADEPWHFELKSGK